ncbi:MAG TPA: HD-GYP domain-containing protein [Thermomicrobiaceae bacterium]|nr:HD-GYP domain-containing protein [Thermomicrobiaceae bacterium]
MLGFIVASELFGAISLPTTSVRAAVSISSALCFGAAITLGPMGAFVVALAKLATEGYQRISPLKAAFNVSSYFLTTFATGLIYVAVADPHASVIASPINLLAAALAVLVFNLMNWGLAAAILSQVASTSIVEMWFSLVRGNAFTNLTLPTLGMLVPILAREQPLAILLMAVPLIGPYLSLRSYSQIHLETRRTVERLANMLDQRDPSTARHSRRVTDYVEQILSEMEELTFEEREAILIAAPVHDIGKIGTSDLVLQKPGKLTDEEREHINRHAADGGDILSNLSLYRHAAVIVRHHHERWDGHGYPDRLAAETIPIGARVIAVADTYDAMTTDRPYRAGLTPQRALEEIERCSGTQFDPRIAEIFLRVMACYRPPVELPLMPALAGN